MINLKQVAFPTLIGLTYEKFLGLIKLDSDLKKLNLLLDTDLSELPGDKKTEQVMANLTFLLVALEGDIKDWLKNRQKHADNYTIDVLGRQIKFNKDLGKLPYWPLTKVKDIVKQMGNEPFNEYEHYTDLVANYLYAKFDKYDEYKADEFGQDVINKLPFTHVIELGDFFLYMQCHLWLPKSECLKLKRTVTKSKPALKFWQSTVK